MSALEQKLITWFGHPAIQAQNWDPRLFWQAIDARQPFGRLKIDPRELEVLFAALMDEPSECLAGLNAESAGRGDFLAMSARRHELPLLTRIYVTQE